MADSDTAVNTTRRGRDDSDQTAGMRVVTGLFGCCTATAILSLLWMVTGCPWVVAGVAAAITGLYMLENMAFYEQIQALESTIQVNERKIEGLKQALVDLTAIRNKVVPAAAREEASSSTLVFSRPRRHSLRGTREGSAMSRH